MPYKWKSRRGLGRSRIYAALPVPLILVAVVIGAAGWRVTRGESTTFGAPRPAVPAAVASAPENPSPQEMDNSRSEISGLRQEVADLGVQVQQQTMMSMAANDELQSLQGQIATAQKKILAANAERDAAVGQASELRQELQRNARHLDDVCEALRTTPGIPPERRGKIAVLSVCPNPAKP